MGNRDYASVGSCNPRSGLRPERWLDEEEGRRHRRADFEGRPPTQTKFCQPPYPRAGSALRRRHFCHTMKDRNSHASSGYGKKKLLVVGPSRPWSISSFDSRNGTYDCTKNPGPSSQVLARPQYELFTKINTRRRRDNNRKQPSPRQPARSARLGPVENRPKVNHLRVGRRTNRR